MRIIQLFQLEGDSTAVAIILIKRNQVGAVAVAQVANLGHVPIVGIGQAIKVGAE